MKINNIIKLILAVLFFVCLLHMPYGYFQLVRFLALLGFAILAHRASEQQNKTKMIVYIGLAFYFSH
jgi:hypothetical protein